MWPFPKDKKLGIAQDKRLYDLPLNKGEDTGFLILLIALMSFLAALAMTASFSLGAMGARWESGLENKLTIEIPAEATDGSMLSAGEVKDLTDEIVEVLRNKPAVKTIAALDETQIKELVAPWLGEDMALGDIPLPGLISTELNLSTPERINELERAVKAIAPHARLDTHESWLNDLLRFTGALQFAALMIMLIIGVTTVTAVAGGIRARMAVNKPEVELLHLMGAKDDYITKQFQRHALILALQGGAIGTLAGGLVVLLLKLISGDTAAALLPGFTVGFWSVILLVLLPAIVAGIAVLTAHFTVLRVLARMP